MAERIFRNVVLTAVLAVLLTAMLIVPALYDAHESSMVNELRQETDSLASALALTEDAVEYLAGLNTLNRITLIASDGTVRYDNMADASQMVNHADRSEVQQAQKAGYGESTRNSDTLSETIVYSARRLANGDVLRLGNTRRSMLGTFLNVVPLIVGMLLGVSLLSMLSARRAARKIVAPMNQLDLEHPLMNETYDELAPLLTRMQRQHEQLDKQMRALENARTELAAIMANMQEGMILLDKHNAVLSMNESAAQIFQVDVDASVGQNLLAVNRDALLNDMVQRALSGESGCLPLSRGGRQYEMHVSPVFTAQRVRGTVVLILDVTERTAAEESRREFTANVSHELKTPLTSISGFAEIIRDGIAQPGDISHFAGMICKETSRLIALVNDILELSRLDERQSLGVKEPVSLMPMMQELGENFALKAAEKHLTLTVEGCDAEVSGYPVLLHELFFNLIDNAVKYTPEGGEVLATVAKCGEQVVCTVQDNGVGIPVEHQAHVFERFYRVDKSHSRQTGGTGLGLAIVKHVAQIHGARIDLQSAEHQGTRIRVILGENKTAAPDAT